MNKFILKLGSTAALLAVSSLSLAARDPSISYDSELSKVKLQHPGSSDEVCESGTSQSCKNFHVSNLWWMYNSNNNVVHKISGDDGQRNELRNKKEWNIMTSNKKFTGTLEVLDTDIGGGNTNEVTILQLHNSTDSSKPTLRVSYNHDTEKFTWRIAKKQFSPTTYCGSGEDFTTSSSGSKSFQIQAKTISGKRHLEIKLAGQTRKCDVSAWPSQTKYYYKMGTYLSDGDGDAEVKFKNWDWNQ